MQEKWLKVARANCPPFILERLGDKGEQILAENVRKNLSFCTDEAAAKRFFDYCKVAGSTPADFLFRQISTPLGELLAAIRMIGGDLQRPAVFIIYKDFELDTVPKIEEVAAIIKKSFAVFGPNRMRWFSSRDETALIEAHDFLGGDLVYVTEFIDHLRTLPLPLNFDRVKLRLAASLDWYDTYATACGEFYTLDHFEWGAVESRETLIDLMSKGLLYEIFVGDEWAGIIAVDKETEDFMDGFLVYEEFLLAQFRGKKLAAAVQRHLIERLPYSSLEMLFGTIHFDNKPSLKTAFRVGRKMAGMYLFCGLVEPGSWECTTFRDFL